MIRIKEEPLAHSVRSFGMRVPNTDSSGSGVIVGARFNGQEGAPLHFHLGVTGFLPQNHPANPLEYPEGVALNRRREQTQSRTDAAARPILARP